MMISDSEVEDLSPSVGKGKGSSSTKGRGKQASKKLDSDDEITYVGIIFTAILLSGDP
jgi:hypothetical protein